MAYLIMLASSACGILGNTMIKQYEKKHTSGRILYLAVLCLFSALFFVVTDKNGLCFVPKSVFYGLLSGFFYCTAYFLTFVAYANGSFVLTNLIVSFSLISSIIYGIFFLEERLSPFGYAGLCLIVVSVFLINISKKGGTNGGFSLKWLLSALGCFVGNSAIAIIKKIQQLEFDKAYDNEYSILMIGSSFVVFLVISLFKENDEWKRLFTPARLYAVGSGICNGIQNLCSLIVNGMMILALAAPLSAAVSIILNFLVSLVFFKERFSALQILGVLLGIASVVLLRL